MSPKYAVQVLEETLGRDPEHKKAETKITKPLKERKPYTKPKLTLLGSLKDMPALSAKAIT